MAVRNRSKLSPTLETIEGQLKTAPNQSAETLIQGLTTPSELEGSMKPIEDHGHSATERGL